MNGKIFQQNLERLRKLDSEIDILLGISALLSWDKDTILPEKAFHDRGEQIAYISTLLHSKMCSDELWSVILDLKKNMLDDTSTIPRKNLQKGKLTEREINVARAHKLWRDASIARKIPAAHVEEMARVSTAAFEAWALARKKKDFSFFAPHLEKLVELKRREAAYIDPSRHPYEVLCDLYEEGITLSQLDNMFSSLKVGLSSLISDITRSRVYQKQKNIFSKKIFPTDSQQKIAREISSLILGKTGRTYVGESIHPFMARISFDDVRMTTTVRESEPMFAFGSVAHESGHALYELQIDPALRKSVLCTGTSMSLHESQSRLWENQICQSWAFWKGYYPTFKSQFLCLSKVDLKSFFFQINTVKPSLIRIESDELTYSMHIIIRYEIEKALLDGSLQVKDTKARWNSLYQKYLGVVAAHDTEGILQDVHWTDGSFGYFPTYALGNVYSAMLFDSLCREVTGVEKDISHANFESVRKWLAFHIHKYGSTRSAGTIVREVCGSGVNTEPYLHYLRSKFCELYGITGQVRTK